MRQLFCGLTFIFSTVKAAHTIHSEVSLRKISCTSEPWELLCKETSLGMDMGYNGGILKYVQNLYNSKKLDILYYILRTCDSLGKESFLQE